MTMDEIYKDTDRWVREMEEEAAKEFEWLSNYGPELEEAWEEIED